MPKVATPSTNSRGVWPIFCQLQLETIAAQFRNRFLHGSMESTNSESVDMEPVNASPAVSQHKAKSPPPTDGQLERSKFMKRLQFGSEHAPDAQQDNFFERKKAPLFSLSVKEKSIVDSGSSNAQDLFPSYALLGHIVKDSSGKIAADSNIDFVLLNTNHPWSAFLCGLQGSGKSHTVSCMLENCLHQSDEIGKLPQPCAGLVFNWDSQVGNICQAAYLCTIGVKVTVLVSPGNYITMRDKYHEVLGKRVNLNILPYFLPSAHLNKERMTRLMAFGAAVENPPLYMQTIDKILRTMTMETQGSSRFNYNDRSARCFRERLRQEIKNAQQSVPLNLRLDILDSFLSGSEYEDIFNMGANFVPRADPKSFLMGEPGSLIVVDLTGGGDAETACLLFDVSLSVFLEKTTVGKVVALDEAHNYLRGGAAAINFIQGLEKTIREQRHKGTRVIVATQEPTVGTEFLDLCDMTIVHRFTSPEWLKILQNKVGGASKDAQMKRKRALAALTNQGDNANSTQADENPSLVSLLDEIMTLKVGESLLFSSTAMLEIQGDQITELGSAYVKLKTRTRISKDGGQSKTAVQNT